METGYLTLKMNISDDELFLQGILFLQVEKALRIGRAPKAFDFDFDLKLIFIANTKILLN